MAAPAKIDWAEAQKDYLTDATMSYKDIAEKYGVSSTSVENHARGQGWVELRNKLGEMSTNKILKKLANERSKANLRHTKSYRKVQEIAEEMLRKLSLDLADGADVDTGDLKNLSHSLRTAIEGERIALGLPNNVKGFADDQGKSITRPLVLSAIKARDNADILTEE